MKIDFKAKGTKDDQTTYEYKYLFENTRKKYTFDEIELEHENPGDNSKYKTFSTKENVGKFFIQIIDLRKKAKKPQKYATSIKLLLIKKG